MKARLLHYRLRFRKFWIVPVQAPFQPAGLSIALPIQCVSERRTLWSQGSKRGDSEQSPVFRGLVPDSLVSLADSRAQQVLPTLLVSRGYR